MPARKVKTPAPIAPLNVRLTPEERADLDAWAATLMDDRGRPLSTSSAVRRLALKAARRGQQ